MGFSVKRDCQNPAFRAKIPPWADLSPEEGESHDERAVEPDSFG